MTGVSRQALDEMARVLDIGPRLAGLDLGPGQAVTQAWRHGELHGRTASMNDHVFMTYVGSTRPIRRQSAGLRTCGLTRPGTVTLIPAGTEAHWDIDGDLTVVHFYISPQRVADLATENGTANQCDLLDRLTDADPLGSSLLLALSEACTGSSSDDLFAQHASALLCAHLLRSHRSNGSKPAQVVKGGLAPRQLRRVTEFLEDRLASEVRLDTLANLAGLSTFHFCRAFKQSTGLPPHRWRLGRRIERAREMLESTDLPITEIAAAVGYDDPGRLASVFRKALGVSPSRYRRERRS